MYSAPGNTLGVNTDMYQTPHQSVLYVFQPNRAHQLGVQAHRPLLYRLTDSFIDRAATASQQVARGGHVSCISDLMSHHDAMASMMPSQEPSVLLNMNAMTDYWRFTLIINQPKFSGFGASPFSPLQEHKVLICGYFLDEPINSLNQTTINPNAMMVFTHKTVIETQTSTGAYGKQIDNVLTRLDANITPGGMGMISSQPDLYFIDPYNSYSANFSGGDGSLVSQPGHLQSVDTNENRLLQTKLQHPTSNVRHVVTNVFSSMREVFDGQQSGGVLRNDAAISMPAFVQDDIHETIKRNLRAVSSTADALGPEPNSVWSLGRVEAEYPNTEMVIVAADQSSMFAAQDQTASSPRIIFSSLICSAAPAILSAFGLARLSFTYESYQEIPMAPQPYGFEVHAAIPLSTMPGGNDTVVNKSIGAVNEFIRSLFSVMQAMRGDFKVSVDIDTFGISQVYLNFKCDSLVITEPYQHLTAFGGMTAPLFGASTDIAHNSSEIASLVNAIGQDRMGGVPDIASVPSVPGNSGGPVAL